MRPCVELKLETRVWLGGLCVTGKGCPYWGGTAVGVRMTAGACHDVCPFSEAGLLVQWTMTVSWQTQNNHKKTSMSMTRQNKKSPPCSPTPTQSSDPDVVDPEMSPDHEQNYEGPKKQPPRFLVVEADSDGLKKINPVILDKTIQGVTSESVIINWLGSALLVEVSHSAYAENLLKMTRIGETSVKVSPHRSFNSSRGVVRFGRTSGDFSNDEIKQALNSSQRNRNLPHVSEVFRLIVNRNGEKKATGTFFLTFESTTLPSKISLGFELFEVEAYVPLPRRCYKCQRYGHGTRNCRAKEPKCANCSEIDHSETTCPNKTSPKCPNCDGPHPASSKDCEKYKTEKEALKIQREKHCSLPTARRQAEQISKSSRSYASTAATNVSAVAINQASLLNQTFELRDKNNKLQKIIEELQLKNASLCSIIDSYEERIQILEDKINGASKQPATPTSLGSSHTTVTAPSAASNSVGSTHKNSSVPIMAESSQPPVGRTHESSSIEGNTGKVQAPPTGRHTITDGPSYIPMQSRTPRNKILLKRTTPNTKNIMISPATKQAGERPPRPKTKC